MEILWLAIIFYSIGLGLVLHFKPAVMFNEDGTWKEFGYQRDRSRHTMIPFWLFAITWAFISYAIAACIYWVYPTLGFAAVATTTYSFGSTPDDTSSSESESDDDDVIPVSKVEKRGRGRPRKSEKIEAKPREGYYVVDPESEKGGLRKYVYYGSNPPPEQ